MRPSSFENVTELGVPFEVISDVIFLAPFKKNVAERVRAGEGNFLVFLGGLADLLFWHGCIAGELKNHLILDCFNQMQPFFFLSAYKSGSSLWKENIAVRRKLHAWKLHRRWSHFLYAYVCSSNKGKCPHSWIVLLLKWCGK